MKGTGPTVPSAGPARKPRRPRPGRVLAIDAEPAVRHSLERWAASHGVDLEFTSDPAQARARAASVSPDVVLLETRPDQGSGLQLAADLTRLRPGMPTVLIAGQADADLAVRAMRAGACDILFKPLRPGELDQRLKHAIHRARRQQRSRLRLRRLRRTCKQLDLARRDISRQVDMLCSDLVNAYHELAQQMQQAVQASEFNAAIRQELDLEQFIRKLLEFVLDKAGPTNLAMFLPSDMQEFTLGGYVNYDYGGDSPDMLLEQLADALAPRAAQCGEVRFFADSQALAQWMGVDALAGLQDCQMIVAPARHEQETLAVLALFRTASQPFDPALVEALSVITPLVAASLERIIRIHHRHLPKPGATGGDDDA